MRKKQALATLIPFVFLCLGSVAALAGADYGPRVFDQANLLKAHEIAYLEESVAKFRAENNMDMVIVTTNQAEGKSSRDYADDFYDYNDFGIGGDHRGILFLIDMDNRQSYISTTGAAIRAFPDKRIDSILDAQYSWLKQGDYYGAFVSAVTDSLEPWPKKPADRPVWRFIIPALIGLAIGALASLYVSSRYKKEYIKPSQDMLIKSALSLTAQKDEFVTKHVTSCRIESSGSSSSSSGGGSSTHTSSSGRSHGGGGRSF